MKLMEMLGLFWNKQIHILISLFTFTVVSVEFILPKLSGILSIAFSTLLIFIVISGVTKNLQEEFKE